MSVRVEYVVEVVVAQQEYDTREHDRYGPDEKEYEKREIGRYGAVRLERILNGYEAEYGHRRQMIDRRRAQ